MPTKTCPFCANEINEAAIKCQFCHEMLTPAQVAAAAAEPATPTAGPPPAESSPAPARSVTRRPARPKSPRHPLLIAWIVLGLIGFAVAAALRFQQGEFLEAGASLLFAVPFVIAAPIAWWLGDVFRQFAMPSWYFGSGALDMAKQRLFWMVGPQSVGVLVVFTACILIGPNISQILPIPETATASPPPPSAPVTAVAAQSQAAAAAPVAAPTPAPTAQFTDDLAFTDYPTAVYAGPTVAPDFTGKQRDDAEYRTQITDAVSEGVNFSGAYTLVEIGCGAGCRIGLVVDLRTGEIPSDLPVGGEGAPDVVLTYKPTSSLFEAQWTGADANHPSCIHAFFQWTGQAFKPLQQREVAGECPDPT